MTCWHLPSSKHWWYSKCYWSWMNEILTVWSTCAIWQIDALFYTMHQKFSVCVMWPAWEGLCDSCHVSWKTVGPMGMFSSNWKTTNIIVSPCLQSTITASSLHLITVIIRISSDGRLDHWLHLCTYLISHPSADTTCGSNMTRLHVNHFPPWWILQPTGCKTLPWFI